MTQAVAAIRWRAVPQSELDWAQWGGDFAVFHRSSGLTHFVNASTALLLKEILVEPQSAGSASRTLAARQGVAADDEFSRQVHGLLLRLAELGLVERVPA